MDPTQIKIHTICNLASLKTVLGYSFKYKHSNYAFWCLQMKNKSLSLVSFFQK